MGRPSHQSVRQPGPGAARDEEEDPGQPHVRGRGYIMCQESSQGAEAGLTITPYSHPVKLDCQKPNLIVIANSAKDTLCVNNCSRVASDQDQV